MPRSRSIRSSRSKRSKRSNQTGDEFTATAISSFPRQLVDEPAVFVGDAFAALFHRQLGGEHECLAQYLRAGQALERLRRSGFGGNGHARRKGDNADVR